MQLVCPVHELGKKNIAQFMNCAVLVHEKYFFMHGDQNCFKSTIMLLILSFDDVTLQYVVWNVYFCVLNHIRFKFYEKLILTITFLATFIIMHKYDSKERLPIELQIIYMQKALLHLRPALKHA